MLVNAKDELLGLCNDKIKCAKFQINDFYFVLKVGYSDSDFETFLSKLDFDYDVYDSGLSWGTVWYKNGAFAKRRVDMEWNDSSWELLSPDIDADLY